MNGRFLLDTNIVIAIFSNDKAVMEQLELVGHSRVLESVSVKDAGQSNEELVIDVKIPAEEGIWIAARCAPAPAASSAAGSAGADLPSSRMAVARGHRRASNGTGFRERNANFLAQERRCYACRADNLRSEGGHHAC